MFLGILLIVFVCLIVILIYNEFFGIGKVKSLQNKHVVITGGSSGIGKAVAKQCAKRGAHVTIIARDIEKLKKSVSEIEAACRNAETQKIQYKSANVTNSGEIEKVIHDIDAVEPIYMFVNCAGMALFSVLEEMPISDIDKIINLNVFGTIYPTRAVMPLMKSRKDGVVVIVSSQGALVGVYGGAAYASSKYALRGLAEVLYFEAKPYNISVTLSLPSDTDTPGFENEEKTKPIETKLICEEGGLYSPDAVAQQLILDALSGRFYSYNRSLNTFCLTISAAGMSPPSNIGELILQVVLSGLVRLILFFYLLSFERIIKKCLDKKQLEKKHS